MATKRVDVLGDLIFLIELFCCFNLQLVLSFCYFLLETTLIVVLYQVHVDYISIRFHFIYLIL